MTQRSQFSLDDPLSDFDAAVDALREVEGQAVSVSVSKGDGEAAPITLRGSLVYAGRTGGKSTFFVGDSGSFQLLPEQFEGGSVSLFEGWTHFRVEIRTGGYTLLIGDEASS